MTNDQSGGLAVYPRSAVEVRETRYFLARTEDGGKRLGVVGDVAGFAGERQGDALLCPPSPANAAALRTRISWLRPTPLGLQTSFGFGDRLGLATPGHVRACRGVIGSTGAAPLRPYFAQQSVRENARAGRTPQQVLDDATWGLFQEGWRAPWGADADHLKTPEDIDAFATAGFTLYTVDPGEHVDNAAVVALPAEIEAKVQALPWEVLEDTPQDMERRYLERVFDLGDTDARHLLALTFDRERLYRAAAKYGRAVAHTARMYRCLIEHLPGGSEPSGESGFELEVSVDETETPTSPEEHFFIAGELRRLGVRWVSLAPRFVGRFEKGVDYIGTSSSRACSAGDLDAFTREFARHVAVARALGPYKLSLHSGSDKLSVYPIAAQLADGLVHVKTAGTSYLEALRAVAQVDPIFFREILALARARYETDRASYHVSADLARVPAPADLSDAELASLFEQFDARQVLHVTFGSVLDQFGKRLLRTLDANEEVYCTLLETHFQKHLLPFVKRA